MVRRSIHPIAALLVFAGVVYLLYKTYKGLKLSSQTVRTLQPQELPFVPKKINFTCDDLFTGTSVDDFNFTQEYYNDLPAFLEEIKQLTGNVFNGDGHTFMFPAQHKTLQYLATRGFVTSVCETGFNYGHSSFTFATAKKDNKVLSFDIGYHKYTKPMMDYLSKTYPGKFITVLGDSSKTIPKYVTDNPSYRCNMFFVDGSHTYEIGYSDLKHFNKIAAKDNIIVFDDFPTLNGDFIHKLGKAWEQAKSENLLIELMRCTRKTDVIRGFTIGQFI